MDKMRMESPDLVAGNIEKIGAIFPNCVTEAAGVDGKLKKTINFDLLKQMLSGDVLEGDEAYAFTWVGKKAAMVEANKPIRKTLRPCPKESKDWDATENLYIEGDNLEVLKLLRESYLGKVKMIYIDPPYNTGNDFIYQDDFARSAAEYGEQLGIMDENEYRLLKNTDANGRFHSDWCSMICSRLMLAREMNAEDSGHRKFIMVQLPEPCGEKSEAYKDGYGNICEIGKERVRLAGEKIKSENPLTAGHLDVGFRGFKLDDTNMTDVYYSADEYDQTMLGRMESNVKPDRIALDLLFGCLLDWGLPLSKPYHGEEVGGCTIHTYNGGDLIACFDENIPEHVIREIAKRKPVRAVFRDSGFIIWQSSRSFRWR